MYNVNDGIPGEAVSELDPGTNLLITGSLMSGTREIALDLLAAGHETNDGMLFIMTSESAAVVIEDLEQSYPTLDRKRIGVIDCSNTESRTINDVATESLSSPRDLTGISTAATKLLQEFSDEGVSTVRHGLVSISTLLEYLEPDTVFKFLHIYTRRIIDTQGLGIFTIDHTVHDPQIINTITNEFDGVIELRQTDTGEREMRIQGLTGVADSWHQLE